MSDKIVHHFQTNHEFRKDVGFATVELNMIVSEVLMERPNHDNEVISTAGKVVGIVFKESEKLDTVITGLKTLVRRLEELK